MKPTAFNGLDRWFGVLGRYRDTSNYYYLILRGSGIVDLKKVVGGTATSLLVTPPNYTVAAGNTYRLKLTINGTALTGTVSNWNTSTDTWTNVVTVNATDSSIASGRAGIGMFKAAAEYNNVLATPNVSPTTLLSDNFQDRKFDGLDADGRHLVRRLEQRQLVYRQTATSGSFDSVAGSLAWTNQSVELDAKANSFTGTNKFFGIVARYTNSSNYYYFILRSNNTVELKKYVGGMQGTLDSASYTVQARRRRSTICGSTRSVLRSTPTSTAGRLEAQDAGNPAGQAGAKVFDAVAEFDNVLVTRP